MIKSCILPQGASKSQGTLDVSSEMVGTPTFMTYFYHCKHSPSPDLQDFFDLAKAVKALAKLRIGKKVVINCGSLGTDFDNYE